MGSTAVKKEGDAPIGATARTSIQLTSRSGRVRRAEVYRCVNVTSDPELEEALFSGALYEVGLPDEDEPYRLALPLIYHDEQRGLFALVVPPALRHREFELRAELLAELAEQAGEIPGYIRSFETVVGAEGLRDLQERLDAGGLEELAADGGSAADQPTAGQPAAGQPTPGEASVRDEEQVAELEQAWQEVEEQRDELQRERNQLDEVNERLDRERSRIDDYERELAKEREALEQLRSELQVKELNLEQQQIRAEQGAPQSNAEESTQVVTEDQLVEVVEDDEPSEAHVEVAEVADDAPASGATELTTSPYADVDPTTLSEARVRPINAHQAPSGGPEDARDVTLSSDTVIASANVSADILEGLDQADKLSFFVQYDEAHGYPLVGLLLAGLDADEKEICSVGWPLDVVESDDLDVLDRLEEAIELQAVLFGEDAGDAAFAIAAPLHDNLGWIRQRAQQRLDVDGFDAGSFEAAAEAWADESETRLGTMRHNFKADSFEAFAGPAEVKLAAGIVGYWSTPEQFEYLVTNRSFPIDQFEAIQERVVRSAVDHGVFINEPLRRFAVDLGLADSERDLVERLVSEYAEVNVGLRTNDLDPMEQWENWEALVDAAEQYALALDPEVLELAEASLKRAQDFQETGPLDAVAPSEQPAPVESTPDDADSREAVSDDAISHDAFEVDELVVARRSDSTGVTYFLPDDAVLDTFDDLASMSREDLELLLGDAKGRLEAAQMLIERFGAEGMRLALEGAENMTSTEVAALARFLETKAEGLEAQLVRCVESAGPSATYVAARALAGIRSTSAIPTLLEAYRDGQRGGNRRNLARTLAVYGNKLLPGLKRVIKKEGHDDALVMLLEELERQHDGVLAELAKDRSKTIRSAADAARSNG